LGRGLRQHPLGGLEPLHREAYTIPFLAEKWATDLEVSDLEGRPYTLPSTQILVARKG